MNDENCTSVIGQDATGPVLCGEPGVRAGEVVKCQRHWARSRSRASKSRGKVFQTFSEKDQRGGRSSAIFEVAGLTRSPDHRKEPT